MEGEAPGVFLGEYQLPSPPLSGNRGRDREPRLLRLLLLQPPLPLKLQDVLVRPPLRLLLLLLLPGRRRSRRCCCRLLRARQLSEGRVTARREGSDRIGQFTRLGSLEARARGNPLSAPMIENERECRQPETSSFKRRRYPCATPHTLQ